MGTSRTFCRRRRRQSAAAHLPFPAVPHLLLHLTPVMYPHTRRLPRNADMQRVSASLVHGVLTVAVPKAPAVDVPVTVETTALPDDLPEPRGQVSLALPGLGAADLQVTITRDRSLMLHVKGSNTVFGSLHEVLRLPERSVATQARASMVNGLFSFSVPIAAEHVQTITVSAEQAPEPMDADGAPNKEAEHKALLLLEAAVPGLQASDFTSEVRGRTLTVHSAKAPAHSKRPLRRAVLLPPHTRVEDVRATCLNGLLKVTAEIHKPERSSVPVSDAEVAALTAAPAPATPAAPDAAIEDANAAAAAP